MVLPAAGPTSHDPACTVVAILYSLFPTLQGCMQGGSLPSRRRQPTPSSGLPISPVLNGNRNKAVLFSTSTSAVVQAVPSSLFSIIIIIELIKYFFFLPLPPICGHCQCCTALRWYPVTPTKLPERLGVPRGSQGSNVALTVSHVHKGYPSWVEPRWMV